MDILIALLAGTGLFLIFLEFIMPSGLLAVLASGSLVTSITLFGMQDRGKVWTVAYGMTLLSLLIVVCYLSLRWVKKGISLNTESSIDPQTIENALLMGKEGIVISSLRPSGRVSIEGQLYHALSETFYLPKDTEIVVVNIRGSNLIVKRKHI
jgi:membrane-bound serine protease (ClpP class)